MDCPGDPEWCASRSITQSLRYLERYMTPG